MAVSNFFALLDDIATLMDDVAAMTKVAAKKTAGILGDDLAVNAEKSAGFVSSREIPVLWAITKGSFLKENDLLALRPGSGISPMEWNNILGKELRRNLDAFSLLKWEDLK